ncbi:hypothetical protein C2G38_614602 [Gigaspora rosea]|uniref:Uncharacterized protein n=1 Tax=Gigaspora rosea TaxID=44941 RepID=A0A397U4N9_9GLOM|nr:hypothetical protein C2G38_614602 [Gigaspora rosea]
MKTLSKSLLLRFEFYFEVKSFHFYNYFSLIVYIFDITIRPNLSSLFNVSYLVLNHLIFLI